MQGWIYLLYFAVFIALVVLIPPLVKRYYYQKLMNDIDTQNYAKFQTHLDSLLAKVSFSAFEREAIRLTMIEARQDKAKIDDQIQFMENMRLNRRQKARLGEQGFYIYLAQGKIKKAARMMDLVKTYGTPQQLHPLEIQYSILLKKEAKYIDELKERLKKLEDSSGNIPENLKVNAGTFQYLIALQYSYNKDRPNTEKWAKLALENLKGTPNEEEILKLLGRSAA
ncbi:hypothetical protein [uncultured Allobaculum sp.]|uniref:hypothetical protein n=1 Tax=uncultured Allobaculum sp. TaxID=1187017 RepID=UPI00258F3032|nr:hypothetical protein [uncultured Allobaculum sp.]